MSESMSVIPIASKKGAIVSIVIAFAVSGSVVQGGAEGREQRRLGQRSVSDARAVGTPDEPSYSRKITFSFVSLPSFAALASAPPRAAAFA